MTQRTTISPKKSIHYNRVNHVIKRPKTEKSKPEENSKKAEFNFMTELKTLLHKTSVESKLPQLKICVRNNQKVRAPKEFSKVFSELIERFGLLFAGNKFIFPEKLR